MGSGDFPASFLQDHVGSGGRNVRPGLIVACHWGFLKNGCMRVHIGQETEIIDWKEPPEQMSVDYVTDGFYFTAIFVPEEKFMHIRILSGARNTILVLPLTDYVKENRMLKNIPDLAAYLKRRLNQFMKAQPRN